MADRTLSEQVTKYLTDIHSIELQALAQLKAAPDIAGDERLAGIFGDISRKPVNRSGSSGSGSRTARRAPLP